MSGKTSWELCQEKPANKARGFGMGGVPKKKIIR